MNLNSKSLLMFSFALSFAGAFAGTWLANSIRDPIVKAGAVPATIVPAEPGAAKTLATGAQVPRSIVACEASAMALCPYVNVGEGRLRSCLLTFKEKLTPECLRQLEEFKPTIPKSN